MTVRPLTVFSLHRCGPRGFRSNFTFRQDCAMCVRRRNVRERRARASVIRVRTWLNPLTRAAKRWGVAGILDGRNDTPF